MRITGGEVFDLEKGFVRRDVCFDGALVAEESSDGGTYDAAGCYVIPGLTDVHFHGCRGADLSDGDAGGLAVMAEYELSRGVTQICPAGMTLPEEQLQKVCRTAAAYRREDRPGAELVGINLEGPFLSEEKKGAQNGAWLHAPDVEMLKRLIGASEGLVKLVSVAPELPGALEFVAEASKLTAVSIAHTAADYDTAMAALRAGAREITHLFNAMPPFLHRAPGVVGAAADFAPCRVELICDGVHIHPSAVRAVFRLFGPERVVLISDSLRGAGMPDGQYTLGGQDVTVKGPLATLSDGTIAGSVTDLMACMVKAAEFGVPLADAVRSAAVTPAEAIGVSDRYGTLEPGKAANAAVLDGDLNLRAVFFRGRQI